MLRSDIPPDAPIGVFDSGMGGLTVVRAIKERMPSERIIYFGDTAHLPYGDKSAEAIRHYAQTIAAFLVDKGVKALVIACNTASAVAYPLLHERYAQQLPVVNVIHPLVESLRRQNPHKVGIIGTKLTIKSGIYPRLIRQYLPDVEVVSMATPLLVPIIEEGYIHHRISDVVLHEYLQNPTLQGIDTLLLACTHYAVIRDEIQTLLPHVRVLDSAVPTAEYLEEILRERNLLYRGDTPSGEDEYYVSDYTRTFERMSRYFLGQTIALRLMDLWRNESLPFEADTGCG